MTNEKLQNLLSLNKELETLIKIKDEIERDFSHNSSCDRRLMYTLQSCVDFDRYWPLLNETCDSFRQIMQKHDVMIRADVNKRITELREELEKHKD